MENRRRGESLRQLRVAGNPSAKHAALASNGAHPNAADLIGPLPLVVHLDRTAVHVIHYRRFSKTIY
jgi:hypothetical protein